MSDRIVPRQRRLELTPEGLTSIQTLHFKPYATLHCRMNDVHCFSKLSFNRTCPEGGRALHLVNKSRHLYRSNVITSVMWLHHFTATEYAPRHLWQAPTAVLTLLPERAVVFPDTANSPPTSRTIRASLYFL